MARTRLKDWKDDPDASTPITAAALEDMENRVFLDAVDELNAHVVDASAAHAASAISYAGSTNVAAANVEAAIDELDAEKAAASHTHTVADLGTGTPASGKYLDGAGAWTTLPAQSSGHTIQDEGSALTARTVLDFQGAGVTATDNGSKTIVTIPGGGAAAPRLVDAGGNIGAGITLATAGDPDVWLRNVILNQATATITITGLTAGQPRRVRIVGKQDATGGRALLINDGSGATSVAVPTAAGAYFELSIDWDGTDSLIDVVGGGSGGGSPTGAAGGVLAGTYPNPSFAVDMALQSELDAVAAAKQSTSEKSTANGYASLNGSAVVPPVEAPGRFRGPWTATTFYAAKDLVTNGGNVYSANADFTSSSSFVGGNWTLVAISSGGGGGSPWGSPMVATRNYQAAMPLAGTNITPTSNQAFAVPFVPGRSCSITSGKVQVMTAASSGAVGRIGIYTDSGGRPSTLVGEFDATVDPTTTGVKTASSAAGIAVTANTLYWLVYVEQGASAANGAYKGYNAAASNPFCPTDPTNFGVGVGWGNSTGFTAALPASPSQTNWSIASLAIAILVAAAT